MTHSIIANSLGFFNGKPVYGNYDNAARLGLYTESRWKRQGVNIPEELKPDAWLLILGRNFKKKDRRNREPEKEVLRVPTSQVPPNWFVVKVEGDFSLITQQLFPLYAKPIYDTQPLTSNTTTNTNTQTTHTPLPLVSHFEGKTALKSNDSRDQRHLQSESHSRRVNNRQTAYVPSALTDQDRAAMGDDVELMYCVCHLLHLFRVTTKKGKDDWIELSSEKMNARFGWRHWKRVRDKMIAANIMEKLESRIIEDDYGLGVETVEERGMEGKLCFGYREREDLRQSKHTMHKLTDRRAIKVANIGETTIIGYAYKFLRRQQQLLQVAEVPDDLLYNLANRDPELKELLHEPLRWIEEKHWLFEVDDFSGRIHNNTTRMKRELRPFLRVNGRSLSQIDVKCCQPLCVGIIAQQAGYHDPDYLAICQDDLYQYLANKLHTTRQDVKEKLCQGGLFAANHSAHQKTDVMRLFKTEFPTIFKFMFISKKGKKTDTNKKPWNKLAKLAQSKEVEIMLGVVRRYSKIKPNGFLTTIHDSALFLPDDRDLVKQCFVEEFAALSLTPRIEVTPL